MQMGQARFLVLNSLDTATVPAENLLPFQVVQKINKFYIENAHN